MKKLLISTVAVASLFAAPTVNSLQKQINNLQKELKQLKANQASTSDALQKVKVAHYEDHINFNYGIRTSLDYLYYKMKDGKKYTNNVLSNRVILRGSIKPQSNLKATLVLQANNIFGMYGQIPVYDNSNWTASETPDDSNLRVKEAYFAYFFGKNQQYMFSAGRRPTLGGYPANLRDNQTPSSPIAHLINMEFDGFSFLMTTGAMGSLGENYGTTLKFCFGRGYSSDLGQFNAQGTPYAKSDNPSMDLGGFVLVPYNNYQYSVVWENFFAWNVQGYNSSNQLDNLGDYIGSNMIFKADGIGNDGFKSDALNNFLDGTKAFISFAYTQTRPYDNKQMLGTSLKKSGYSIWVGADMPVGDTNDRWGVNVVEGSSYFRPMTYGEDTLAGSIAAVRGTALETYYNKVLTTHLTANFRATYMHYRHAGSNAFFGEQGDPNQNNYVADATDIRAYIRYRY